MQPLLSGTEFADAIFQAVITAGLAGLAILLHRRIRARWLAWWAAAWGLYVVRLLAIITFLATGDLVWLFWHQVATGWVALIILWAALVFSRDLPWRNWYLALAAFPLLLGWLAVNRLDQFMLVAIPMVALIAGATLWTGWVFWRHARRTGSGGARFVAIAFMLWGIHHLDYPFLRARGAWVPWGYFLDILFELAVGIGFGVMVLSDLATRLGARTDELARLRSSQVRTEEITRRRLARELHDESAQTFSAVRMELGLLRETADSATAPRLDRLVSLVDDGIGGVRRVINDLRPALLDDLGLATAIRSLASDMAVRGGIKLDLDIRPDLPAMSDDIELALFRSAQESLTNALRHSGASELAVALRHEHGAIRLMVRDNGRGLPADGDLDALEQAGHLGLAGMRERLEALGGTMSVISDRGVKVEIVIGADRGEAGRQQATRSDKGRQVVTGSDSQ